MCSSSAKKGRIRLVNPALVRLFPQAKDAEGKFPVEVIPAAEIQQALDELLSAPQDKPPGSSRWKWSPART